MSICGLGRRYWILRESRTPRQLWKGLTVYSFSYLLHVVIFFKLSAIVSIFNVSQSCHMPTVKLP